MSERLRAFVRERVHKDGQLYERGAAVRLAAHLEKPSSWVSHYVDTPPQRNADIDTALAICAFFYVTLDQFKGRGATPTSAPSPPVTRPARPIVARAVRLLEMTSDVGVTEALVVLRTFARAYPLVTAPESHARSGHISAGAKRTARDKR